MVKLRDGGYGLPDRIGALSVMPPPAPPMRGRVRQRAVVWVVCLWWSVCVVCVWNVWTLDCGCVCGVLTAFWRLLQVRHGTFMSPLDSGGWEITCNHTWYVTRNSKSAHQPIRNTWACMLSLSSE